MTQFASQTTAFPNGVSNCDPWQAMSQSGVPDPSFSQLYHNEFNTYTAADWTVSNVGVTPTNALVAEVGGVLLNTTTAGATDSTYLQLTTAGFQLIVGTHHFFKCRLKLSDATNSAAYAGLIMTSATPLSANDGLFFYKATGQKAWILRSIVGGVATDLALPAIAVAANATYQELSFHVDPQGNVEAFFNPTTGAFTQVAVGGTRGRVASFNPTVTQALLAPSFGILNGAAAAKTLSVDYITVSSEL